MLGHPGELSLQKCSARSSDLAWFFFLGGGRSQDEVSNKYLCGNQPGHSDIPHTNAHVSGVRVGCESNEIGRKSDSCLSWWIL